MNNEYTLPLAATKYVQIEENADARGNHVSHVHTEHKATEIGDNAACDETSGQEAHYDELENCRLRGEVNSTDYSRLNYE